MKSVTASLNVNAARCCYSEPSSLIHFDSAGISSFGTGKAWYEVAIVDNCQNVVDKYMTFSLADSTNDTQVSAHMC